MLNDTLRNATVCPIKPNSGITWHFNKTHIYEPKTTVRPIITL